MSVPSTQNPAAPAVQSIARAELNGVCETSSQAGSQFTPDTTGPVTVWLIDTPDCSPYAEFIEQTADRSLYYSLPWREALCREGYGEPVYLLALRGERPVGVLPMFRRQDENGWNLASLPGTPMAGVWAADSVAETALVERAAHLAAYTQTSLRQRSFAKTHVVEQQSEAPAESWVRLAVDELHQWALQAPASPPVPDCCEDTDLHSLLPATSPAHATGIDEVLAKLAQSNGHPGHLLQRGADGARHGMAVWLKRGEHAYLLGYRTGCCANARRETLGAVANRLAAAGVKTMDMRLPAELDEWMAGIPRLPGTLVSVEHSAADETPSVPV